MSGEKRWNSIDFIKGVACIAVVLIHFNFPGNVGLAVRTACKFGVPVFFFVSGFFLGWSPQESLDANKVVRKIRHIFVISGSAAVFYAVFTVFYRYITGETGGLKEYIIETVTAAKICKFFVQNDPFLYGHLWFLGALIYCYLFVLFIPFRRKWSIGILAGIFMTGFLLLSPYHLLFPVTRYIKIPETETVFSLFNFFLFRSLGFFLMGIFCKAQKEKILGYQLPTKLMTILAVAGGCVAVAERMRIGEEHQFYIGTYLTCAALVIWAIQNPAKGNRVIVYIGRELSLYIYILHIAIGRIVNLYCGWLPAFDYTGTFIILGSSVLIAWGVNRIWKAVRRVNKSNVFLAGGR